MSISHLKSAKGDGLQYVELAKRYGQTTSYKNLDSKTQLLIGSERDRRRHVGEVCAASLYFCNALGLDLSSIRMTRTLAIMHESAIYPFGKPGEVGIKKCITPYNLGHIAKDKILNLYFLALYDDVLSSPLEILKASAFGVARINSEQNEGRMDNGTWLGYWMKMEERDLPYCFRKLAIRKGADESFFREWGGIEGQIIPLVDGMCWNREDIYESLKKGILAAKQLSGHGAPGIFQNVISNDPELIAAIAAGSDSARRKFANFVVKELLDDAMKESLRISELFGLKDKNSSDVYKLPCLLINNSFEGRQRWEEIFSFFAKELYSHLAQRNRPEGSEKTYIELIMEECWKIYKDHFEKRLSNRNSDIHAPNDQRYIDLVLREHNEGVDIDLISAKLAALYLSIELNERDVLKVVNKVNPSLVREFRESVKTPECVMI